MGPNFRFYVLFLFSKKKQKVWYHKGYSPCFSEKSNFFTLFCSIASFYKIRHRSKTSGHRKKRMWFSALESKTAYAQMFFLHFEVKSRFYGENKKKFWKKSWNFDNFSASRCDISATVGPISMIFFANCSKFYSLFILKKERFLKIINFEKSSKI